MDSRLAVLLLALASGVAHGNARDPPAVVARLSYAAGGVTVESGATETTDRATANWPITSGDRVRTDMDSRAELSLGTATVHLGEGTDLLVSDLDRSVARMEVSAGSVSIHLAQRPAGNATTVQVPNATSDLLEPGDYRIDVSQEGGARIAVQTGALRTHTLKARFQQLAGEQADIASDGTLAIVPAPAPDAFDRWSLTRARHSSGVETSRHVAKGIVGYEDLDTYGAWRWERDYGMVWEPKRVAREWAPYRFGQWIWKQPWGWTWVDDAPWGFAPFHFGRWIEIDTRWFWVPGPRQIPAVYAPALVRFTEPPGEREPTDWYPLGPGEEYVPPYSASEAHVRNLNTFAVVSARDRTLR